MSNSSEFKRLYRELCKANPSSHSPKKIDSTYQNERQHIFHMLGFDVGFETEKPIETSKHMGMKARKRAEEVAQKGKPSVDSASSIRREQANFKKMLQDSNKINQVAAELKKAISARKSIGPKVVTKLPRLNSTNIEDANFLIEAEAIAHEYSVKVKPYQAPSVVNHDGSSILIETIEEKPASYPPARVVDGKYLPRASSLPAISSDFLKMQQVPCSALMINDDPKHGKGERLSYYRPSLSTGKWTLEERERLTSIFRSVPKPAAQIADSWLGYLYHISTRHRAFYPKRSDDEIAEKLRHMMVFRTIKTDAEANYWTDMRDKKSRKPSSSDIKGNR